MNNKDLRQRMKNYRERELEPALKRIAFAIPMNYNYFTEWYKGSKQIIDEKNLVKIDTFLKSKGY